MCLHLADDVLDKNVVLGNVDISDTDVREIPDHTISIVIASQLVTALIKSLHR